MKCVVVAGGIPNPEHALYPYTQGNLKAAMDKRINPSHAELAMDADGPDGVGLLQAKWGE